MKGLHVDGEPYTARVVSTVRGEVCTNLPKKFGKAVLSYSTYSRFGRKKLRQFFGSQGDFIYEI